MRRDPDPQRWPRNEALAVTKQHLQVLWILALLPVAAVGAIDRVGGRIEHDRALPCQRYAEHPVRVVGVGRVDQSVGDSRGGGGSRNQSAPLERREHPGKRKHLAIAERAAERKSPKFSETMTSSIICTAVCRATERRVTSRVSGRAAVGTTTVTPACTSTPALWGSCRAEPPRPRPRSGLLRMPCERPIDCLVQIDRERESEFVQRPTHVRHES